MRYRTLLFTMPGFAMILSMAACGSEQHTGTSADKPSGTTSVQPSGPSAAQTALTVRVKASAKAPAKTWTLDCDPTGGDHPKAAQACSALAKVQDPFKPVPKDQMCTQIYGGPEVATVKGTWKGKPVDTTFSRKDGCQLHRWSQVGPLFGDVPKVR